MTENFFDLLDSWCVPTGHALHGLRLGRDGGPGGRAVRPGSGGLRGDRVPPTPDFDRQGVHGDESPIETNVCRQSDRLHLLLLHHLCHIIHI